MTNQEKSDLRYYCRHGYSFNQIRGMVACSDSTIRKYMNTFSPKDKEKDNG